MLGSEAPAVPTYPSFAQAQMSTQPAVPQLPQLAQPPATQLDIGGPTQHAAEKETDKDSSGLVLPLARVKRIIKSEGDVKAVSSEASFAVARAAELLLEELARRANMQMQSQHRSTLQYKDVAAVVHDWKALTFLSDIVPQQVAVSTLLEKYRQQHPELVHVQPQPQVHQQMNGVVNPAAVGVSQPGVQHPHAAQQILSAKPGLQQPVASNLLLLQQQQQLRQQQPQQQLQQQPTRPVFAQPHSQQMPHSQLAQLVQPRMQHFPVAEQVQQMLPARQAVSGADASYGTQRPAAQQGLLGQHQQAVNQTQALPQQPLSVQLPQQGLSGQLHALSQQQLAAQLQKLTAQQAQQQPLLQQLQQQQQRAGQPLAQHPSVAQFLQQQVMHQQQQQQQQQQPLIAPPVQLLPQHSQSLVQQPQIAGQQTQTPSVQGQQ